MRHRLLLIFGFMLLVAVPGSAQELSDEVVVQDVAPKLLTHFAEQRENPIFLDVQPGLKEPPESSRINTMKAIARKAQVKAIKIDDLLRCEGGTTLDNCQYETGPATVIRLTSIARRNGDLHLRFVVMTQSAPKDTIYTERQYAVFRQVDGEWALEDLRVSFVG